MKPRNRDYERGRRGILCLAIQKILYATDDDGTVMAEAQVMVSSTEREPNSYHDQAVAKLANKDSCARTLRSAISEK